MIKDRSNDEIKEIINNMKEISSFEYTTDWFELNYKDTRILLDYITNLQKENQKKDAYIKYLEEYNPKYYKGEKFYGDSREELQQRIDKAVEYIEDKMELRKECPIELLNILKGDDENGESKIDTKR